MILRIEDTDRNRFVEGAENYIIEALQWCGIRFDEGVPTGGPHAPYRQSERGHIYRDYVEILLNAGWAYYAFDTPDEIEAMRKRLIEKGVANPQYDHHVRMEMKNSLSLGQAEIERLIREEVSYVVRFKIPENNDIYIEDLIRGEVHVKASTLDDKVLFKSDGMPTYHLANVVDDHLMEITHVIRGEEWLPSAPLHQLLYDAFGWKAPEFAHLPLLLKPDGNGKLSKRDGDRLGFPVFPLEWKDPISGEMSSGYRESGYFPEAFINFLAMLGWNPGTEKEIFSMDELINVFSLERISKKGAKFDLDKARWFNQQYLRLCDQTRLVTQLEEMLKAHGITSTHEYVAVVVELVKERAIFAHDLYELSDYFFTPPEQYDAQVVKKHWNEEMKPHLKSVAEIIRNGGGLTAEDLKTLIMNYIDDHHLKIGQVMNCMRLALVGKAMGPDLFLLITTIGVEEAHGRIVRATKVL